MIFLGRKLVNAKRWQVKTLKIHVADTYLFKEETSIVFFFLFCPVVSQLLNYKSLGL